MGKAKGGKKATANAKAKAKKDDKAEQRAKKNLARQEDDYRSATGVLVSRQTAKDVKIDAFSLSAYGNVLITDTMVEFTIGRRYGLIGSNGSGKSTYLKCLAAREVPIPDHIDIFHLEKEVEPSDVSALQTVVNSAAEELQRLEDLAESIMEIHGAESDLLTEIYNKMDLLDADKFEADSAKLLTGLGFSSTMMNKATKDLSGGWRMRVILAEALLKKPTLLLLDEPTNHLDLEACVWLEMELANYPNCLVVVSHSQDFLNGVCTNITEITPRKTFETYTGNYDQYIQTKKENEVRQMKAYQKEQDDIKHIKQFIASCGTFSNLVKQAKSKQKILDKMYAAGLTPAVDKPPTYSFQFNKCERVPPPAISFENVCFSYSGKPEDYLYTGLNLGVDMDSRIAVVGPNGAGKSTLLKLMVQDISPSEGLIKRHLHVQMGRYHQHSADILDPEKDVLTFMIERYKDIKMDEEDWRKAIGRYGVTGKQQKTPIKKLSDGIKSRIIFAMLAIEKPNLLLLDEPTNHLDMHCIDALADAIKEFEGGVILVSHDFRLLDQVAKEVWICDNKSVTRWTKGIRAYKKTLIDAINKK